MSKAGEIIQPLLAMKTSFVLNVFWVAIFGVFLSFSAPVFADGDIDLLNQALDLVHQAWNPGGDPPSNDQRTDLLNQALKLVQQVPPAAARYRGHRARAIDDIKAALFEIGSGDPNNKATDDIRDADFELRAAISTAT
jgi:hypothetical protein